MKKITALITASALTLSIFLSGYAPAKENKDDTTIDYHYLTQEECAESLGGIDAYYQQLNQKSLDFFMQKKGATADEYREYSMKQAEEMTEEEQAFIDELFQAVEKKMADEGMKLPKNRTLSLGLTTMKEGSGATGYTHGTTIYLNKAQLDSAIEACNSGDSNTEFWQMILAHEIFHCLTRNNPEFRKDMYKFINFTVTDADYDIPDEIYEQILSNPDVEHHDSYAEFTIDGEKKNCYLVFLTEDSFEKPGDSLFDSMYTGLVDIEDEKLYSFEEASDFYEVVGENTTYCEDPEECMATNFSYAIAFGMNPPESITYKTPELIENIIDYMQQ